MVRADVRMTRFSPEPIPPGAHSFPMTSLKPFTDCDCLCHKGGVVIHVAPCCDGYVPGQSKQKSEAATAPHDVTVREAKADTAPRTLVRFVRRWNRF